ncbi:transposase family protein [Kutzneria sp. NPDC052558]|uniref:transposase family protein n=1 Tax=Kutzneria sp. NPDC052558 TaxID=3364121 RepID=UPI0037CBD232
MLNDTTRLLGLTGLAVVRVDDAPHDGPVVHLITTDEQARTCPGCAARATRMKEWVTTSPRDLPAAGRRVDLRWCKRRWHCDQPGCARKTFTEAVDEVPARARLTDRLRQAAGAAVADGGRTIVQSARDHGLSWPIVSAAFTAHATTVLPDQPTPVTVLGIDEIRRGRPQWTWNDRMTVQIRGRRGRKGNREWELRNRLTCSAARMHAHHLDPMVNDLRALPAEIGQPILAAWNAKEDLLDLLALARTHPDRAAIWTRLSRFYKRCGASGLPELERLASTVSVWWPEILAFIDTGITNDRRGRADLRRQLDSIDDLVVGVQVEPGGSGDDFLVPHRQDIEILIGVGQAIGRARDRGEVGEYLVAVGPHALLGHRRLSVPPVEQGLLGIVDQILHAVEGAGNEPIAGDGPLHGVIKDGLAKLTEVFYCCVQRIAHGLEVGFFDFRVRHRIPLISRLIIPYLNSAKM